MKASKKRGSYGHFDAKTRAAIGKYSCENRVVAAARYYSKAVHRPVNESTVRYIKKAYLEEQPRKRRVENDTAVESLPTKKRGRPLLLRDDLDSKVQAYAKKIRESGGGSVSARVVQAAARGIVLKSNPCLLSEHGSPIELSKEWAHKLLRQMGFVKWKVTTSKSHMSVSNFEDMKKEFLQEIVDIAVMEETPPELILNWDQTGINLFHHQGGPWSSEEPQG